MKNFYSLSVAVMLSLSLLSCDDKEKDNTPAPTPAPAPAVVVDPRAKFIGTFAGTLGCTNGQNTGGNIQIVAGPSENQIDVVGSGIATINGNTFTIPEKTTSSNGMTLKTSATGTLNATGNSLSFSQSATTSIGGQTSSATCSGYLAKQ